MVCMSAFDKKIINRWIDLSNLPYKENGRIDWKNISGQCFKFIYGEINGTIQVIEYVGNETIKIYIDGHTDANGYLLKTKSLLECRLGNVLRKPIAITHPELIKYFANINDSHQYSAHSNANVEMICPLCQTHKTQSVRSLTEQGFSCPMCGDGISYPEKLMFNILTQLELNFKNQVSRLTPGFEWIEGQCRYDFYLELNDAQYFIEMDGQFHTKSLFQTYDDVHAIDMKKDNISLQHGIQIIRVDCAYDKIQNRFEYIKKSILNSQLKDILNIELIDWDIANRFATDSNIRLAAELWNTNNICTKDISNILGVSRDTARGYLKIAYNLGLCNYTEDEINKRMLNKISKNNKNKTKPIALYKNNILINVFESIMSLDEKSIELYGVHIDYRNIYAVCNGNRKHTRGYAMSYITKEEYNRLRSQFSTTIQN